MWGAWIETHLHAASSVFFRVQHLLKRLQRLPVQGADVSPRVVHLAGNLLERLKQQIPPEKHRVIPPVGQFAQLRRNVALLVHQAVNIPVDFGFQVNDSRHRVRQTIRRMIAITFTATFVYVVFAMLRPALFAGLFTTDPELIAIVAKVLPVYIAGMAIFGLQSGVQSSFLGLGQAKISLFIALLRKVILLIPLALILPHFFGVMGVYYAEPIADVCSVVTAVTLFLCNIWKILSKETLAKVTHTEA